MLRLSRGRTLRRPARAFFERTDRPSRAPLTIVAWAALQFTGALAADMQFAATPAGLARLTIEELAEIEVSSVSRHPERLADAPAAVYVITSDDIRRSGVTTLAEALRLAPNLQVARVNASSYAISARGFNSESANKLLVMIDGRSVYTPLHSGVFWDAQDVMLADVDRIEVISGPGGTLWGANAVNGVINILTRSAKDSVGTLATAAVGDKEQLTALRHGMRFGDNGALRLYARTLRVDNTVRADGSAVADAATRRQVGARGDWGSSSSAWTLQGDAYDGRAEAPGGGPDRRISGANLLTRWTRELGGGSGLQVQAYVDTYARRQPGFFNEDLDTVDVDLQHRFTLAADHQLVWGGGYRMQRDRTSGGAVLAFVPADSTLRLASLFAQDTIALGARTKLTVGIKAEHNSYTGLEYQPNVRIAWKASEQSLLWGAVSRATRTPSRLDRDLQVFTPLGAPYNAPLLGGSGFVSERVTAYEVGYRGQPTAATSFSASAFVNRFDRLRSIEPVPGGVVIGNGVRGHSQGVELWGNWQVGNDWRLSSGLTLLHQSLGFAPGSRDPGSPGAGGNDPQHQFSLRSSWTLAHNVSLDVALRAVGALPAPAVPAYTALDLRLGWAMARNLALSLAAFNLGGRHAEFGAAPLRSEISPSALLRLTWSY
jgi:iron complex outermembrane receptor protein